MRLWAVFIAVSFVRSVAFPAAASPTGGLEITCSVHAEVKKEGGQTTISLRIENLPKLKVFGRTVILKDYGPQLAGVAFEGKLNEKVRVQTTVKANEIIEGPVKLKEIHFLVQDNPDEEPIPHTCVPIEAEPSYSSSKATVR